MRACVAKGATTATDICWPIAHSLHKMQPLTFELAWKRVADRCWPSPIAVGFELYPRSLCRYIELAILITLNVALILVHCMRACVAKGATTATDICLVHPQGSRTFAASCRARIDGVANGLVGTFALRILPARMQLKEI